MAEIAVSLPTVDTPPIRALVLPDNISVRPALAVEGRLIDEIVGSVLGAIAELGRDLTEVVAYT